MYLDDIVYLWWNNNSTTDAEICLSLIGYFINCWDQFVKIAMMFPIFFYLEYPSVLSQHCSKKITQMIHENYFQVSDVQMNIFMPGKVLYTIYFLKGNNTDNSNLILLG